MKKIVIIGLVVVGLILGGTSFVGAYLNDDHDKANNKDQGQAAEEIKETNHALSIDKIKEIVLSKYEGHIEDIELEHDDDFTIYEVEVENGYTEYELIIDAYTGEVLAKGFDDDGYHQIAFDKIMSVDKAKKIALEHVSGDLKNIELDENDGRYEYEIELKTNR